MEEFLNLIDRRDNPGLTTSRFIAFIAYPFLIYLFPFFICVICALCHNDSTLTHYFISDIVLLIYKALREVYYMFTKFELFEIYHILGLLFLGFIFFIYFLPFLVWYKKQTLLKAWLLSCMGFLLGPGIFYIIVFMHHGKLLTAAPLIIICVFYFCLYLGGKLQEKYFPANKGANKIRHMLLWPCLHT